jgi:hypothetical protein
LGSKLGSAAEGVGDKAERLGRQNVGEVANFSGIVLGHEVLGLCVCAFFFKFFFNIFIIIIIFSGIVLGYEVLGLCACARKNNT